MQDTGSLNGGMQGPQDASFASMNDSLQKIVAVIKQDPAVANVTAFTGGGGATNTGNIYIALKPLSERKVSATQIIARIRPKLNRLPVASVFLQAAQDFRIGGRGSNAMYQYTLQSDNVADLSKWGPILRQEMRKLPGFQDVNSDQQNGGLDEMMTYDRANAAQARHHCPIARFGALWRLRPIGSFRHPRASESILRRAGSRASVLAKPGRTQRHLPATGREQRAIRVLCAPSRCAPSQPARRTPFPSRSTTPDLFPSVTVSFNLECQHLSQRRHQPAIQDLQRRLGMPSTIQGFFAGTLLAYQQSLSTEPILVLCALLAVYIVLGVLYESLVHPLTIISSLPPASVGAMLALMLFKVDLNIISIIGIVLLIGIVKKNAIMMIDFALQAERDEGKSPVNAIFEACMLRFRPILMTTMAALMGALPLAFGTGTGSELRRPLGITIIGGLIMSQLLTLYTTPVVYLTFDRMRLRMEGKRDNIFGKAEWEPSHGD